MTNPDPTVERLLEATKDLDLIDLRRARTDAGDIETVDLLWAAQALVVARNNWMSHQTDET